MSSYIFYIKYPSYVYQISLTLASISLAPSRKFSPREDSSHRRSFQQLAKHYKFFLSLYFFNCDDDNDWLPLERGKKEQISRKKPMPRGIPTTHTEKSFRNLIVYTNFRLIWNKTDVHLVPNQSENSKYNLISGWFNKISNRFLCVQARTVP